MYINVYMYILCLIGLWTMSPKTEVEKLRIVKDCNGVRSMDFI